MVKPGHVVAVLGASSGAPAAAAPSAAAQPKAQQQQATPTQAAPQAPAPAAAGAHRVPSLKFPPRYTQDGRQISAMTARDQEKELAKLLTFVAPPAAQAPPPIKQAAAAAARAPPKRQPAETRAPVVRSRITQREMDIINLGGAW